MFKFNKDYELWCLVEFDDRPFCVRVPSYETTERLKELIKYHSHNDKLLQNVDPRQLILRKDNSDLDTNKRDIFAGKYRPTRTEEIIDQPLKPISHEWPSQPPVGYLHVFVSVPATSWSILLTARWLHLELWGKGLSSILEQVPDCSEKYVSQTRVAQLQLRKLGFKETALLVREEYITAIDMLEGPFQPYDAVVITGQPGIGKSYFLYYVLLHRLCSGKCTAFQLPFSYIIFQESGVTTYDITGPNSLGEIPEGSWALADSNDLTTIPCATFRDACGKSARVIQTSSPKRSPYPSWTLKQNATPYVMNHFSPKEFIALGKVLGLSGDALRHHSKKWGPSARTCVQLERSSAVADFVREPRVRDAAAMFVYGLPRRDELDIYDVSHTLLAIRPGGPEAPQRVTMIAEVPTDYLNQVIAEATAKTADIRKADFYDAISKNPSFDSLARYIFKTFFCARFLGRRWSPTLHCSSTPPSTSWLTSSLQFFPVCNEVHQISDMASLNDVDQSNLPVGWWPVTRSFDTVNALICTDRLIITIQVTVTSTHRVNLTVLDKMKEHFPPPFLANRRWCHLFVTDKEYKAEQLRANEYEGLAERNITVHSTVVDISKLRLSEEDIRQAGEIRMEDEKDVD